MEEREFLEKLKNVLERVPGYYLSPDEGALFPQDPSAHYVGVAIKMITKRLKEKGKKRGPKGKHSLKKAD